MSGKDIWWNQISTYLHSYIIDSMLSSRRLTFASLHRQQLLDGVQRVVVIHREHVFLLRLATDRGQLRLIDALSDTDREQTDAGPPRLLRLRCSLLTAVRPTGTRKCLFVPEYKQSQITLHKITVDIIRNNFISENGKTHKTMKSIKEIRDRRRQLRPHLIAIAGAIQ